jgi:HTH-type transcriptional regulator / antitoxin HipB
MTRTYPLQFASQLRQHLKSLRKKRGLTQAQAGALIGVSQARMAEIEANPGVVGLDQLMHLLSALHVTLLLSEESSSSMALEGSGAPSSVGVAGNMPDLTVNKPALTSDSIAEQVRSPAGGSTPSENVTGSAAIASAVEQARKGLEDNALQAAARQLEAQNQLKRLAEALGKNTALEELRKKTESLAELTKTSNYLIRRSKGDW